MHEQDEQMNKNKPRDQKDDVISTPVFIHVYTKHKKDSVFFSTQRGPLPVLSLL